MRSRTLLCYLDPEGERHGGMPTYPWRMAPVGLATRRQLRDRGLQPGRQPIAAQVLWRRYGVERVAYLYRLDLAKPKRPATHAQLAAVQRALAARRRCPTCRINVDHYIPHRFGECVDCAVNSGALTPVPAP